MRVERMRQAILQGVPLDLAFAKPAMPPSINPSQGGPQFGGGPAFYPPPQPLNFRPNSMAGTAGRGHGGPPMEYGTGYGGRQNQSAPAGRGRGLLGEFGD